MNGKLPRRMKGQSLVEMAFALPVFLIVVFGVMDIGRAVYTYNGLSNLARESSHYAMLEYSTDPTSPCFWASFNSADCLTQVKNYAVGLNQVPGIYGMNVSVDLVACQGTCTGSGYPITVSMATHFQPVSTSILNIGPFDITSSSTEQFVHPPAGGAMPTPTPTTTGSETAVTNVGVTTTNGCSSQCDEFLVTWTPPPNVNNIGHYELAYGTGGTYEYSGPEPAIVDGNDIDSATVLLPGNVNAECIQVNTVYWDGTQAAATGSWNSGSSSPPTC